MSAGSYSQGIAPYADLFGDAVGRADGDLAFVQRHVRPGASVLDVGAGVGNLAFALAAAGHRVTALEPDGEMFGVLMARLALRPDLAPLVSPVPRGAGHGLGQRFDAVVSMAVFHLLDERERRTLVEHAAQHLVPGGVLLLDVAVEGSDRIERPRALADARRFGDVTVEKFVTTRRADGGDARWLTTWEIVVRRGEERLDQRERRFEWQASRPAEVRALLQRCDFVVGQAFADQTGSPFVEGVSRSWLAVARLVSC